MGRSKSRQEPPRSHLGRSKSRPEPPKSRPRGPKSGPRVAKRAPGAAQKQAKSRHEESQGLASALRRWHTSTVVMVNLQHQHKIQQLALAHAMREPTAKKQIVTTVQESADAKELLAVLADSGNEALAPQAVQLLESAEPGASGRKRRAELKRNGVAILFNRQKQEGWAVPSESLRRRRHSRARQAK